MVSVEGVLDVVVILLIVILALALILALLLRILAPMNRAINPVHQKIYQRKLVCGASLNHALNLHGDLLLGAVGLLQLDSNPLGALPPVRVRLEQRGDEREVADVPRVLLARRTLLDARRRVGERNVDRERARLEVLELWRRLANFICQRRSRWPPGTDFGIDAFAFGFRR